jgi:hypothetical protein
MTNLPIESYNNFFKNKFSKRVKYNMLPVMKLIEDAVCFESSVKMSRHRKVDSATNTLARSIMNSDHFTKEDESPGVASYKYVDARNDEFMVEISHEKCQCSECNTCNCVYYHDIGVCAHIAAACIKEKKELHGCFIPISFVTKNKKGRGRYMLARNALARDVD